MLSQTVFFFGAIPGMLFCGWFSGTYGRLPTIIFTNIIVFVTGVTTPFITGYFSFFALRFVMGLAFTTCFTGPYILGKYHSGILQHKHHKFVPSPGVCRKFQKNTGRKLGTCCFPNFEWTGSAISNEVRFTRKLKRQLDITKTHQAVLFPAD